MLIACFVVGVLAVARLTLLLTQDRLTAGYRRWVVRRWGASSMPSYLVHCEWCTSMWVALIMPLVVFFPSPWLLAVLSVPATSLLAGFIATTGSAKGRE